MTWGIIINSKNLYLLDFVMQPQFADTIFLQASGSLLKTLKPEEILCQQTVAALQNLKNKGFLN